jgi:hypothetical protein
MTDEPMTFKQQSENLLQMLEKTSDEHVRHILVEETLKIMYAWGKNGVPVKGGP